MLLTEKKKRKKRTPTAQSQVKNKVNAGIMDAVTCCGMCENEHNDIPNNEILKYIDSINDFVKKKIKIEPLPKVELNHDNQDGLFITTGYYLPQEEKVVIFCKNRHIKDILRSYVHELIHHKQNLEGRNMNFTNSDNVKDNKELETLESEAYLKGNIFFRKWTEYERSKNNILNESYVYTPIVDEALEPDDVDLSSFNIKKNLNPKFWKDGKIDSRIRMKLLDIADDFIEFLGVDWVKPEDITITGSLANYNWNQKHSDIDLHIIMDFTKVDKRTDFVNRYFQSQKTLWNKEHEELKIYGFSVELYVQDINQKHTSNGVFSLEKNEWLKEPERDKLTNKKINKNFIKHKVSKYTKKIDNLIEKEDFSNDDEYKLNKIYEFSLDLFNEIKTLRKKDLNDSNNEINNGNIIFKSLRRLGYIEKLDNLINRCYDKLNSLP